MYIFAAKHFEMQCYTLLILSNWTDWKPEQNLMKHEIDFFFFLAAKRPPRVCKKMLDRVARFFLAHDTKT
jgi:hypothetical protein